MKNLITLTFTIFIATSLVFAQEFNDLQIASIAVTANQVDIDYAEIAVERSGNDDIIQFAETMIRDHNAVIEQAVKLVTQLGVEPDPNNELTNLLNNMSIETKEKLRSVNASDFDKTYIDNEVAYHETVIEVVRDILILQADNNQLKELLEAVLPSLEAHLVHAKTVQNSINNADPSKNGNGY